MVRVAVCEFFSLVKRVASRSVPKFGSAAAAHLITRVAVAGVLLAASLLKFGSISEAGSWLAAENSVTFALATIELIAALALVVRRPGPAIWSFYILGFVLFACISGYHAWNGAPTCGCFGNVAVPPAWTLALDLAIVAALLAFPPAPLVVACKSSTWALSRGLACIFALASVAGAASAAASLVFAPPDRQVAPGVILHFLKNHCT